MGAWPRPGDRGVVQPVARRPGPPRPAAVSAAALGVGEVRARTVPACGMPPPAGGVAGDVDADFHHQLGFHQRDVQLFLAAGIRVLSGGAFVPGRVVRGFYDVKGGVSSGATRTFLSWMVLWWRVEARRVSMVLGPWSVRVWVEVTMR
ncbi:hypothetical protein, partial [Streptomyces sp. IBSBF 2806]|uniref:hypothetical protein n=1 Tax=Streptomyces sp. IBSBF 2806 TaxID=2903529 RepID=UPI002FDBB4CC